MSRVLVSITETDVENDNGNMQPGIEAKCIECDHVVECFGQSEASRKRACVMLREECPEGEENFYIAEEDA